MRRAPRRLGRARGAGVVLGVCAGSEDRGEEQDRAPSSAFTTCLFRFALPDVFIVRKVVAGSEASLDSRLPPAPAARGCSRGVELSIMMDAPCGVGVFLSARGRNPHCACQPGAKVPAFRGRCIPPDRAFRRTACSPGLQTCPICALLAPCQAGALQPAGALAALGATRAATGCSGRTRSELTARNAGRPSATRRP